MGFSDFFRKQVPPEQQARRKMMGFWSDNPQDPRWLKTNQNTPTAGYKLVYVDINKLIALPGQSGEHLKSGGEENYRGKLNFWLNKLSQNGVKTLEKEPPLVIINAKGAAQIKEGNHRIYASHKLGYPRIPITLLYLGGSEMLTGTFDPAT